jgi:hypothetical protein
LSAIELNELAVGSDEIPRLGSAEESSLFDQVLGLCRDPDARHYTIAVSAVLFLDVFKLRNLASVFA